MCVVLCERINSNNLTSHLSSYSLVTFLTSLIFTTSSMQVPVVAVTGDVSLQVVLLPWQRWQHLQQAAIKMPTAQLIMPLPQN